jgi:hypothetical protein
MSTIHMGTDNGTVPWCGSHTGPTTRPDCIKVFRNPRQPLPPTLQPCALGTPPVGPQNQGGQ